MSFTTVQRNACLALVPLIGSLLPIAKAHGQNIASDDAVKTQIKNVNSQHFDIRGGQLSEDHTNLFHSFDRFDITAEPTANSITEPAVQHVEERVSSHAASRIEGKFQFGGSNANLYLMNSADGRLGPEAQLNLSDGFTATTASGIELEPGGQVLRSQGNIESAIIVDGTPTGSEAQRRITANEISGQIQVEEIQTNTSDVSLNSADRIEIELINTRENRQASTEANSNIDTQANFGALAQTADTVNSIATNSTQNNAINLRDGNTARLANAFTIDSVSNNGTTGSIGTALSHVATSPRLSDQTTVGNIQLPNRGKQPIVTVDLPSVGINQITATTVYLPLLKVNKLTAKSNISAVSNRLTTASEAATIEDILTRIESGASTNFAEQLDLANRDESQPEERVRGIQNTLREVEHTTNSRPAIVYVYFVPGTKAENPAENSVAPNTQPIASPHDQLEMVIVTSEDTPVRQRQWEVTRSQIDEASQTLHQQITSQFSTNRQYLPPAQQLYNWIVSPLEQTLQQRNVNSIGFVMDAGLRMLPVAALHDGEQYLVENYSLGILPTFTLTDFSSLARQHAQHAENNPTAVSSETQVLAMGASTFEHQPDLPAVGAEIDLIAHKLWEGDAFLNEDFVLENFQQQLRQKDYGIVHLATHAVFEAGNSDHSYIQLWDEQLSLTELSESLRLSETEIDLIILSACSTALGDEVAEYGFAGLAVNAGSQSALASLWPVNDESTLGFISQFYHQLKTANIRSGALQQAQVSLIRGDVGIHNGTVYGPNMEIMATIPELAESGQWDFSHPSYWSAFTMIGNPW